MNHYPKYALLAPLGRVERLCLITMACFIQKRLWTVNELNQMLTIHRKMIRQAVVKLAKRGLLKPIAKTEMNAYLLELDLEALEKLAHEYRFNVPDTIDRSFMNQASERASSQLP